MRRIESREPGDAETLTLAEAPEPLPVGDEVVIAVSVCGINYPDALIIEDRYQVRPSRPFAPGSEVSGVAGPEPLRSATRLWPPWLRAAGRTVAVRDAFAKFPDAMPMDEAGAFMMTYGTSYFALADRGGLRSGETLLVHGAGGGVGLAAVQIGKAMGARVVAAASSEEKLAAARAAGADAGVLYPSGGADKDAARAFGAALKATLGPGGADVIYDPVGGALTEAALRNIAWRGRYLVIGFAGGVPNPPLNLALLKQCAIVGVWQGTSARAGAAPSVHGGSVQSLCKGGAQTADFSALRVRGCAPRHPRSVGPPRAWQGDR